MDVFPEIRDQSRVVIGGDEKMYHVEFSGDSSVAFDAPLTEFTSVTLLEGGDLESLRVALKELSNVIKIASNDATEPVFGETVEVAGTFIIVAAWESPEVRKTQNACIDTDHMSHQQATVVRESITKEYQAIEALAKVETVYAILDKITDPGDDL